MQRKQIRRFLIAQFIGGVGCLALVQPKLGSTTISNNATQVLRACIPTQQVAKAEVISTVEKDGNTYYLLAAYQEGDPEATDLLISINQQTRCSLLLYNPMGDVIPLSRFVPMEVAQLLALQRLKIEVEKAGGRAAFQQSLNAAAAAGPTYWAPEEVWAVQKLGIQLPKNTKLVDPKDIKVSEPSSQ